MGNGELGTVGNGNTVPPLPFPVPSSPTTIPRSPTTVPHSPTTVPHSPTGRGTVPLESGVRLSGQAV